MMQDCTGGRQVDITPAVRPEFWRGIRIAGSLSALLWWGLIEIARVIV